jgi:tRNA(Ile)-lysidine synthase
MSFSAASLHAVLNAELPGASAFAVALSGGADSAALLCAVAELAKGAQPLSLRALHIDHGLQAAAAQFREACEAQCRKLGVTLSIISVTVDTACGESIEAAARDARYLALQSALEPNECLLTAHHREDQAQTLLLQALRGSGLKGLAAMPKLRALGLSWHLRPLLDVAQQELLEYGARCQNLASSDPMNQDLRFDRSYLRQKVWPTLIERWPGAAAALSRTARHLAEAQVLLDLCAASDLSRLRDGEQLSVPVLRALPALMRINAVRLWLTEAGVEAPSTARLSEALRQVFDADEDQLPAIHFGNFALRRYRQRLFLTEAHPPRLEISQRWDMLLGATIDLPNLGSLTWAAQPGGLDPNRLPRSLTVRARVGGESLRPAAAAKTKTVQHLCQSLGVLPWMRDAMPLVFAEDALVAVADLWADARWRAPAAAPGLAVLWNDAPNLL